MDTESFCPSSWAPDEPANDIDAIDGPDLLAWRGHGVVILAFPSDRPGSWVVARGWRRGDQFTDVRRWSFPSRATAARQLGRLVRDATASRAIA